MFSICLAFFDSRLRRALLTYMVSQFEILRFYKRKQYIKISHNKSCLYIEIEIIIYMAISDKYDPPAPEGTQPVKQESESEN